MWKLRHGFTATILAFLVAGVLFGSTVIADEATPTAQSALARELADCPMPVGYAIPESEQYFTPWGVGAPPIWLLGFSNPPESLHTTFPSTGMRYMGPAFADSANGWSMRALWVVQGSWTTPVTIHGERVGGGTPLTFDAKYGEPSVEKLVLDPAHPGIPVQHGDWREWPSSLFVPSSGCYELSATWDGGNWSVRIPLLLPPDFAELGLNSPTFSSPEASPVS